MNRKVLPFRAPGGAPADLSDEGLVAACATGDKAALGALFDRHHDATRRFLARRSGSVDRDLDDLVQLTFEAVSGAAGRFDGRATVRTWLFGVANNIARHHIRAEVRRRRATEAAGDELATSVPDASAEVLERERRARLSAAIHALPTKLREAFVLVYVEELPGREVASQLGLREGTLWKRLHDARARLRGALEGSS